MKYLVHLRPSDDFSGVAREYIHELGGLVSDLPSNVFHCSLMSLRMDRDNERKAVRFLEKVVVEPFRARGVSLDIFDGNSLVLRLDDPLEIRLLHLQIIRVLGGLVDWSDTSPLDKKYIDDPNRVLVHARYGNPYCAQFYNPHISICGVRTSNTSDIPLTKNSELLKCYGWDVNNFWLSRKEASGWKTVKGFSNCGDFDTNR